MCVYIHICVYINTQICVYMSANIRIYFHLQIYTHILLSHFICDICMYEFLCVHLYKSIRVYQLFVCIYCERAIQWPGCFIMASISMALYSHSAKMQNYIERNIFNHQYK